MLRNAAVSAKTAAQGSFIGSAANLAAINAADLSAILSADLAAIFATDLLLISGNGATTRNSYKGFLPQNIDIHPTKRKTYIGTNRQKFA